MLVTTYRRKDYSVIWHYSTSCSNWPSTNYVELLRPPRSGELCSECPARTSAPTPQTSGQQRIFSAPNGVAGWREMQHEPKTDEGG